MNLQPGGRSASRRLPMPTTYRQLPLRQEPFEPFSSSVTSVYECRGGAPACAPITEKGFHNRCEEASTCGCKRRRSNLSSREEVSHLQEQVTPKRLAATPKNIQRLRSRPASLQAGLHVTARLCRDHSARHKAAIFRPNDFQIKRSSVSGLVQHSHIA